MTDITPTTPDPDTPVGLGDLPDLRPDGSIRFSIDDVDYRLRMPRLGELRQLRDSRDAIRDQARIAGAEAQRDVDDLVAKKDEITTRLAEVTERDEMDRIAADLLDLGKEIEERFEAAQREMSERIASWTIGWFREAVALLSRPRGSDPSEALTLPDDDDLPVWCSVISSTSEWIEHWMTHPKRPGA